MINKLRGIMNGTGADAVKKKQLLMMGVILGGILLFAVGISVLNGSKDDKPLFNTGEKIPTTSIAVPGQQVDPREAWATKYESQQKVLDDRLKQNEEKQKQQAAEIERLTKELKAGGSKISTEARSVAEQERAKAATGGDSAILPPLPPISAITSNQPQQRSGPQGSVGVLPPVPGGQAGQGQRGGDFGGGIMTVSVASREGSDSLAAFAAATPGGKPAKRPKEVDSYVPSGSFTKAIILSGMYAPTGGQGQQNPVPALLRMQSLAQLPNRYRFDVKECFVVVMGTGNLSDERAYMRPLSISCVMKDGRVIDQPIKGWVSGSDGIAGVRGILVTKQGQVLANALLAGVVGGIGDAFAASKTTQSTSPLGSVQTVKPGDALEHGIGIGFEKALDRLANYYISLAEKLFPVIEVQAGQEVEVILEQGFFFGETDLEKDVKPAAATTANASTTTNNNNVVRPASLGQFTSPEKMRYGQ